jgi:hypothetical protein
LEAEQVGEKKEFMTSSGWITNFKKHHSFQNMKISGEAASAYFHAAKSFPRMLKETSRKEIILQSR